ncbi:uncharacterized protein BX663DRAFT_430712 [Cokeromyces recurvatus]|uniref:uncharacterized protein n=1 Tax=Cokeromyces recurvatus TaxID=90255 RepID=UPI00221FF8B9|nr:uncharacterized protein BX663DRAFT_430712 [Cokeromyces recurvatus]KAI7905196.1 hypothetical protein BX663DRAFT_430712 [Cokeromyces recurvatus]
MKRSFSWSRVGNRAIVKTPKTKAKIMKLHAPGLYTIQHIGSVDIPSSIHFLRDLRKKTIPRLKFMKYHALKNAHILLKPLEKEAKLKKKSTSYRRSPSYDDAETCTKWTRSTWFPSSRAGAPIVILRDIF